MEQAANRRRFDARIAKLEHDMVQMAALAEGMMGLAVDALSTLNPTAAWEAIATDDQVDALEVSIENECLICLALEHPMGADLRKVSAILKIVTDIERYADIAVELAKIAMQLEQDLDDGPSVDLPLMGASVKRMILEVVQRYVNEDAKGLDDLVDIEDDIDELYRLLRGQIFDSMTEDPSRAVPLSRLLIAVHLLEKAGDLCLSMADRVLFVVTGNLHRLSPTHRPRLVVADSAAAGTLPA
jgi:phosphate transport system protein